MNSRIVGLLPAVQVAAKVGECRSFAAAARELGLSPSAISKSVARLEQQLGMKLFQRTTRSVRLTPDGEQLLGKAHRLFADFDSLLADVSGDAARVRGRLRITAPETFGRHVITPLIAGFLRAYPEVEIELDFTDRYVDLAADPFDLAVRSGRLVDSTSLVSRPLQRDPMVVVAARDHEAARVSAGVPGELLRYPAVVFRNSRTGRGEPWRFAGNVVVRPQRTIAVSDMASVLQLVIDGLGIAQVPQYLARAALESNLVVELVPAHRPDPVVYSAVYLERRLLARNIRAFVDYCAASLARSAAPGE